MRSRGWAVVVCLAMGMTGALGSASGAAQKPTVAIFGLANEVEVKPKTIFLSANAGPRLIHLKWKGWGTTRATAAGTYVSDCASCAPPKRRPAKVVLRKLGHCKPSWGNYDTYLHGSLTTIPDNASSRRQRKTVPLNIGLGFCTKYDKG